MWSRASTRWHLRRRNWQQLRTMTSGGVMHCLARIEPSRVAPRLGHGSEEGSTAGTRTEDQGAGGGRPLLLPVTPPDPAAALETGSFLAEPLAIGTGSGC